MRRCRDRSPTSEKRAGFRATTRTGTCSPPPVTDVEIAAAPSLARLTCRPVDGDAGVRRDEELQLVSARHLDKSDQRWPEASVGRVTPDRQRTRHLGEYGQKWNERTVPAFHLAWKWNEKNRPRVPELERKEPSPRPTWPADRLDQRREVQRRTWMLRAFCRVAHQASATSSS